MAIQFCAVPLKLRKTFPGMEIHIAVCKNKKRDIVLLLCFTRLTTTSQLSIRIMKSTPTNRSIMIILMGTKPGYLRKKKHFFHLTSDSIRLAAAIGAYGQ